MRIIRVNTLNVKAELDKARKGLEQGLDDASNHAQNEFLRPAEAWDNQPVFEIQRQPGERSIFTTSKYYYWVNFGTNRQGRRTLARPGSRLHLPSGWEAKTSPYDLNSSGGDRSYVRGENLHRSVPMSSITARRWDAVIGDAFEAGLLRRLVQEAINRA